jgi:hypothetical protein
MIIINECLDVFLVYLQNHGRECRKKSTVVIKVQPRTLFVKHRLQNCDWLNDFCEMVHIQDLIENSDPCLIQFQSTVHSHPIHPLFLNHIHPS